MKTSSKIILENIRIDKQLRINVALVNDKQLNTLFNDINHHIDELNNTKMNEHEKIFTLEILIKDLIEFNNKTFFKLYTTTNEKVRETERVKRLKSFLDIRKDVEDELPVPDDDEDDVPSIPPALKRKLNL
tara:strand:+ start:1214 stop:1606 length:393 start_codon:yes stop_codon:yes gene_type:complete